MSTINLYREGETTPVIEVFTPKTVSDILNLNLIPFAYGLRVREGSRPVGPTYTVNDNVPAGSYVVSVHAAPDKKTNMTCKQKLENLDNFKLKKKEEPFSETEGSDDVEEGEEGDNKKTSGQGGKLIHLEPTIAKGTKRSLPFPLPENRCEFCNAPIETRRVTCTKQECRLAYKRSRAKFYREQKRQRDEGKSPFHYLVRSDETAEPVLGSKENEATDDEATDDDQFVLVRESTHKHRKQSLVIFPVNESSPFWKLVPESTRLPPTPVSWDRLGVGHANPEKGIWYRAAYVYGSHHPNHWHERTVVCALLDRDNTDAKKAMRSVFLPRANNLRDTPFFPPLDRSVEPAHNMLLMMKGEGRGLCGYQFMVWNPTKSYVCPMTLLLSRSCPFPESCPILVKAE